MIEFGIKKPVTTLMLVIAMILFSAITTFRIPVELNPSGQSGLVSVITRLRGGVAASEVEKYVTKPLEEVFAELEKIITRAVIPMIYTSNLMFKCFLRNFFIILHHTIFNYNTRHPKCKIAIVIDSFIKKLSLKHLIITILLPFL